MKKLAFAAIAAAMFAAPAIAGEAVLKFDNADGTSHTVTLDKEAGTVIAGDKNSTFTWDEGTNTLCTDKGGENVCVTFEAVLHEAGATSTFTATDGATGTVTLVSIH